MLDLAALGILELGIGYILDLDFSWFGVDDTAIFAHDKSSLAVIEESGGIPFVSR
jgi:hypothetical protein